MKIGLTLAVALFARWLFVSDIHLDPFANGAALYHYAPGDTPTVLWDSSVREMRARVPNAPVVVIGGDLLAHNFAELARQHKENPQAAAVAVVKRIATDLARAYPKAQFLVTLGNNDDPCGDYRSEIGGAYQSELAKIWEPLVNRNGAAPNFADSFIHGGYYTARLPGNDRALVLNSVLWSIVYRGSCTPSTHNPGAAELSWLQRELALPGPRKNVLVMHVPPGYDAKSTTATHRFLAVPFLNGSANRSLLQTIGGRSSRIAFALAAHVHRYEFRVAGDVPILVGSSISPVYRNNPAFFALDVAPDGTLKDVEPYIFDLQRGEWRGQPSFDSTFGIDAFTASNLRAAAARIENDPATRETWIDAYDVWSWRMGDVSDHRWRVFWCAAIEPDGGYAACAGTQNRFASIVAAAAIAVLVFVLGIVLLVRRRFSARR